MPRRRTSPASLDGLPGVELFVSTLQMLDVLLVLGTAFPPANQNIVPEDLTILELPPLLLSVELGRERGVYYVRASFVVGGHLETKRLAKGHRVAHPGLPEIGRASC